MGKQKHRRHDRHGPSADMADVFRPFPKCASVLEGLGATDLLQSLRTTYETVALAEHRFADCKQFHLLDDDDLMIRLGAADDSWEAEWLWRQVGLLLIVAIRTTSSAMKSLSDGIAWGIGNRSELPLALSIRAFIEQACAIDYLRTGMAPHVQRLNATIWPHAQPGGHLPTLTEQDRGIHEELMRFNVGGLLDSLSEADLSQLSSGNLRWWQFYDSMYQRRNRVPERYRPKEVCDYLYPMKSRLGTHHFRAVYARLCEYCHPNAASRSLEFQLTTNSEGKHLFLDQSERRFGIALSELVMLAQQVIPQAGRMACDSLTLLSECVPLVPGKSAAASDGMPPIGSIAAIDQFGRSVWVQIDQCRLAPPRGKLTAEEELRIQALHEMFGKLDNVPIQVRLENFRREACVEDELRVWERMAEVYRKELEERALLSVEEQRLLYTAILKSTMVRTLGELLSVEPSLKGLPQLDRVFARSNGGVGRK